MNLQFLIPQLLYLFVLFLPFLAIPLAIAAIMLLYIYYQKTRKHPKTLSARQFAKCIFYPILLLIPFMANHCHKNYLQHKWYAEKRASFFFTELTTGNYKVALKHFDPQGKIRTIALFKKILLNGNILKTYNFEIAYTQVNSFEKKEPPSITVYTYINDKSDIVPLLVNYNEMMAYPAHNLLE